MENIAKLFKSVNTLLFTSSSLYGSKMNWNYNGNGKTIVNCDINKIYFLDRITLDNKLSYEDKKMWVYNDKELEFWHYRNNSYEKIFTFYKDNANILLTKEYVCGNDIYMGKLEINEADITFMMEIKSDKKNELIKYRYLKQGEENE